MKKGKDLAKVIRALTKELGDWRKAAQSVDIYITSRLWNYHASVKVIFHEPDASQEDDTSA